MKVKADLAQVVNTFGRSLLKNTLLSPQQIKTLHNIVNCSTATLGGHKERCDTCEKVKYHYNSCGDRHCPKCQYSKQIKWIDKLQKQVLPIKHYHVIFTVPHSLNEALCRLSWVNIKVLFLNMGNSEEIFTLALGLDSPWQIDKIIFDKANSQLDIYLKFTRGHKFKMSDGLLYTAHDAISRKWEHLNFFQHKCYLHANIPRVKRSNGEIQTQPVS